MSATEELRSLLDEKGVEWRNTVKWDETTWVKVDGWHGIKAEPWGESTLKLTVYDVTPVQAMKMMMGREKLCRLVDRYGDWYCTNCDEMVGTCDNTSELHVDSNTVEHLWKYCPYCGARVIASVVEL